MMDLCFAEVVKIFPQHSLVIDLTTQINGFCQDSRKIRPGEIYVAIRGDQFDGHDFIDQAFAKGACAALVENPNLKKDNLIYSPDSIKALGQLAHLYRKKFLQPVIAITGSNGKTTTKEFLAHVLSVAGKTIATHGNLNNHIGVPLTVFRFSQEADFFIVEMGMNHLGEIAYLTEMVQPDYALVTSVGRAHLEGVGGSIDGVAQAKGELFLGLTNHAVAFINSDDFYIKNMPTKASRRTFGKDKNCDVVLKNSKVMDNKTLVSIECAGQEYEFTLQLVGAHHVSNAVAVFLIAKTLGLSAAQILKGLETFQIDFNRGRLLQFAGKSFIDDTYNANPDSVFAAMQSLKQQFQLSQCFAVLGEMKELGDDAEMWHEWVGKQAKSIGMSGLFVVDSPNARAYLRGFGIKENEWHHCLFASHEKLAEYLLMKMKDPVSMAFLVKGSRGANMERVLIALEKLI